MGRNRRGAQTQGRRLKPATTQMPGQTVAVRVVAPFKVRFSDVPDSPATLRFLKERAGLQFLNHLIETRAVGAAKLYE